MKETTEKSALRFLKLHIKSERKEIKYNEVGLKKILANFYTLILQEKKKRFSKSEPECQRLNITLGTYIYT